MMENKNVLFEILAGSYEEYTLGFEFIQEAKSFKLVQSIATHSHQGSLRSIAVYNGPIHNILATGSADEYVHLYDLQKRKECGSLSNHNGTVNCVRFTPDGSYIMTASSDGSLAAIKVGSWYMEKLWTSPHKGLGVLHLSIHPSGKMALTIGADEKLIFWNLVKGRPAYIKNLTRKVKKPELVEWSVCGTHYGIVNDKQVDMYSCETAEIVQWCEVDSPITSIIFLKENKICIGESSGNLTCFSFISGEKLWEVKENDTRVKAMTLFGNYLITVDGKGTIYVYDVSGDKANKKTSYESKCRITCLAVSKLMSEKDFPKKKKKRNIVDIVDDSETNKKIKIHFKDDIEVVDPSVVCSPKTQKWDVKQIN